MKRSCIVGLASLLLITSLAAPASAMYHPRLGRFLSRDPEGGANLHQYCSGSPAVMTDPFGLMEAGEISDHIIKDLDRKDRERARKNEEERVKAHIAKYARVQGNGCTGYTAGQKGKGGFNSGPCHYSCEGKPRGGGLCVTLRIATEDNLVAIIPVDLCFNCTRVEQKWLEVHWDQYERWARNAQKTDNPQKAAGQSDPCYCRVNVSQCTRPDGRSKFWFVEPLDQHKDCKSERPAQNEIIKWDDEFRVKKLVQFKILVPPEAYYSTEKGNQPRMDYLKTWTKSAGPPAKAD